MRTIDLQRRLTSERADELLDRLQSSIPEDRRRAGTSLVLTASTRGACLSSKGRVEA
jgi:hypothetical protein